MTFVDCILVLGNLEYSFRQQRPQKLAAALSKSMPVIYVSPDYQGRKEIEIHRPLRDLYPDFYIIGMPEIESNKGNENLWNRPLPEYVSMQIYVALILFISKRGFRVAVNYIMHPAYCEIHKFGLGLTIYDCMDYMPGFGNVNRDILALEHRLIEAADCTVFTSEWLQSYYDKIARKDLLVRNGYDIEMTNRVDEKLVYHQKKRIQSYAEEKGKVWEHGLKVIYAGAIAHWFAQEFFISMVEACKGLPIVFIIIGRDDIGLEDCIRSRDDEADNIVFWGEVTHEEVLAALTQCDIGLISLDNTIELIKATNPVKLYEYLSLGLQALSTPIPEVMRISSEFISIAETGDEAKQYLAKMAQDKMAGKLPDKRLILKDSWDILQYSSWDHRAAEVIECVESMRERFDNSDLRTVTAIIPTAGKHQVLVECLRSLRYYYFHSIIIVVNGAYSNKLLKELEEIAADEVRYPISLYTVRNPMGFAKAVNMGFNMTTSKYSLIVNDDIISSPWSLLPFVDKARGGGEDSIYNVTTTNIDGDAYREHSYISMTDFYRESLSRYIRYGNCSIPAKRLGMNCSLLPMSVVNKLGGISEEYGLGYGEDDQFYKDAIKNGITTYYLPGAYVHHIGSLTFNTRGITLKRRLLHKNVRPDSN